MSVTRAAGILIYRLVNEVPEYLLLQASYEPFHWTPPKGHVDPGEDEWQAAFREVKEEAAVDADNLEVHKDFEYVMKYDVKGKPKTVTYWLARLITADIQLSHEHQNWSWNTLEPAIKLTKYPEMDEMLRKADDYLKVKK